jgi:hypothetical protein
MRPDEITMQRAVVRLVLARERELDGLERLLGSEAVPAVKSLAAAGVVLRHGERLWASPCVSRLEDLGLVIPKCLGERCCPAESSTSPLR